MAELSCFDWHLSPIRIVFFLSVRFSSQFSQASFLDGADIGCWKGFVQVRNWCRKNCCNCYVLVIVYIIIIAKLLPCYVKFRLGLKMICIIPPGLWRLNMTPPSMVWFFMRLLSGRAHPRTKERYLLHIMCGYQCDKAVNENDTREVIWYHFIEWSDIIWLLGFELSNQIDCNNLFGPIGLHVIF